MKRISPFLLFVLLFAPAAAQSKFRTDFLYYWQTIHDNYAYFDKQTTKWERVKQIYLPVTDTLQTEGQFIHLLERANNELYNGHTFLNTNTASSNRSIPTGADIQVGFNQSKFTIAAVRKDFNAEWCGLRKGMQVIKFNDVPIDSAVQKLLPKSVTAVNKSMYDYAATTLLAGTHNQKRKITVLTGGIEKDFYPDTLPNKTEKNYDHLLDSKLLAHHTGYIKINNALGNTNLIAAFDAALDSLMHTDSLVLDLTETPSGGNTTVARAIMGRFINTELPYQKHIYVGEEKETGIKRSTLELVSPRQKVYSKPLTVLVNYWTGSMGEGIAIGFYGMKRATVVGTKMAGLLGEISTFETPELKIPFSFPTAQLQTVQGQPREDFLPVPMSRTPGYLLQ